MATKAERLPSGSYRSRAEYKDIHGTRRFKSFTVAPIAGDWRAAAKKAEMLARQFELQHPADTLSVLQAVQRYVANRSSVCSPSTLRAYQSIIKTHLAPFEFVQCCDISSSDIQSFINRLSAAHSPKTTRNVSALLLGALAESFPDRRFAVSLPRKRAVERHIPQTEDVQLLLRESSGELRLLIALAAMATLRLGEACGLRVEDVDPQTSTIHVRGSLVHTPDGVWLWKDHPKTASSVRSIPVSPELVSELVASQATSGLIFSKNPHAYGLQFIRLRSRLGLKCRFHDLRHYSASVMELLGIPSAYQQSRGGWSSDAVLKSTYQHAFSKEAERFAAQTNRFMSSSFGDLVRGTNVAH